MSNPRKGIQSPTVRCESERQGCYQRTFIGTFTRLTQLSVEEPHSPSELRRKPLRTFARLRPLRVPAERGLRREPRGFQLQSRNNVAGGGNRKRHVKGYTFPFHRVMGSEVSQEEAFKHVALPVLNSCMEGHNGCIFCYGQTGSGKTYTMSGGEGYAERGIIPRCIEELFAAVERFQRSTPGAVSVSYLEVYNENAYDLLCESVNPRTPIEHWPKHTPCGKPGTDLLRRWKLHLVDLAGSERVWKKNLNSQVLQEAKYINRSLHFLEQVINSLQLKASGQRFHVPYRNSLLTSVLRDSLAGNCMTVMVANVAVNLEAFDESVATCRFAQRCSRLVNNIRCTDRVDWETMCKRLTRANKVLMEKIKTLENKAEAGHDSHHTWSVREVLQNTNANLAKHPKDRRKYLLGHLRARGLDIRFSCVADLCAMIQVLNAKLELTDGEKKVLRRQLVTELQKRQEETVQVRLPDDPGSILEPGIF
ncbi:krp3, putative [Perkinsus marinus ATCC 50983]|uniref:Krp3, putative n=1 Tax=Perkinsus marinus (strain ATCC 50983 / TXsc) TaxID=423536 RepID=C5KF90_PERM5|nr:krp3, putative [Perkinsus marinus ATCC 50983]EER16892.1 krp3, putative [Perkinsus marinus ATCC 50983]|eukprot:XP_002785096.1 krp3, putative [Perkinsus marinus ATCC 50983]